MRDFVSGVGLDCDRRWMKIRRLGLSVYVRNVGGTSPVENVSTSKLSNE